jgi:hypothetical protein
MLKKKIWASFQRIIELFAQNLSLSSQKYGFGIRDPGSGSRGQKGTGSRIRIGNTEIIVDLLPHKQLLRVPQTEQDIFFSIDR